DIARINSQQNTQCRGNDGQYAKMLHRIDLLLL
ncbi:MAG: hypothetical protein ACI9C4_003189, partial [Paraglaciecola sp.]